LSKNHIDLQDTNHSNTASKSIRSVETGVRVLDALLEHNRPMPLREIAAAANLSRSQAHRYLAAYVNTGLVVPDALAGHYHLGPYALKLGLGAYSQLDISLVARNAIDGLVKDTNLTGLVTIWGSHGPTVIRWTHGAPPIATSFGLGSVLPLLSSTAGHVFLAFLPSALTAKLAKKELRLMPKPKKVDVINLRERVRSAGYATGTGIVIPGLSAISAPILNHDGEAAAVLGLIDRSSDRRCEQATAVKALLKVANAASENIGFTGRIGASP
jgi:DNA-binding IclR family transcriptional regulator